MAIYNTPSDAANTAIRAFLTKIGEHYWQSSFNTATGKGSRDWQKIKNDVFENECAYCGVSTTKLQMEHLVMFNRKEFGLHHPGNVVPVCAKCNSRSKKEDKSYNNWEDHLSHICETTGRKDDFYDRWTRIKNHFENGEFAYPKLTKEEQDSLRIIANHLYENVKKEFDNAITLYKELDSTFSRGTN